MKKARNDKQVEILYSDCYNGACEPKPKRDKNVPFDDRQRKKNPDHLSDRHHRRNQRGEKRRIIY